MAKIHGILEFAQKVVNEIDCDYIYPDTDLLTFGENQNDKVDLEKALRDVMVSGFGVTEKKLEGDKIATTRIEPVRYRSSTGDVDAWDIAAIKKWLTLERSKATKAEADQYWEKLEDAGVNDRMLRALQADEK